MGNCKARLIGQIERFLADSELTEGQRQTLQAFDRFNELEAQCRHACEQSKNQLTASRVVQKQKKVGGGGYPLVCFRSLYKPVKNVKRPFEEEKPKI